MARTCVCTRLFEWTVINCKRTDKSRQSRSRKRHEHIGEKATRPTYMMFRLAGLGTGRQQLLLWSPYRTMHSCCSSFVVFLGVAPPSQRLFRHRRILCQAQTSSIKLETPGLATLMRWLAGVGSLAPVSGTAWTTFSQKRYIHPDGRTGTPLGYAGTSSTCPTWITVQPEYSVHHAA